MTPRDPFVISMDKAIEPVGEAKNDYDIFAGIARCMDTGDSFTEGRSAEAWQKWIWEQSRERAEKLNVHLPAYESFREAGFYKSPDLKEDRIFLSDFFEDPDKNPLKPPSG